MTFNSHLQHLQHILVGASYHSFRDMVDYSGNPVQHAIETKKKYLKTAIANIGMTPTRNAGLYWI